MMFDVLIIRDNDTDWPLQSLVVGHGESPNLNHSLVLENVSRHEADKHARRAQIAIDQARQKHEIRVHASKRYS
jgi:hypothetical protein